MVYKNILIRVSHSDWASPIVLVHKNNGDLCECVDFKVIVIQVLKPDVYPLSNINDILIGWWEVFCTLDLLGVYQQIEINEDNQELLPINTIFVQVYSPYIWNF